ncbi:hypothetical protein [Antiquaquibacter soli]|uniref:SRPBCC family protein n=1 Tax=Antiquaquibacter soli TaxID=3064523 RepID=A0ABT9BRJ8_9MICO|nr:hypothetical protein [Protaetiibacter sp. WY-16]MDO7883580.1 hypothetical protein [Protaetiibacter sp. WY-16]
MVVQPSGRVVRDRRGLEVIVERRIPVPAEDVWGWLSSPAKVRKWISGARPSVVEPGERVELVASDWSATLSIAALDSGTIVYAKERADGSRAAADAGPRWEHSLDRLVAAIGGAKAPALEPYLATQRPYYERLAMDGDPMSWPPS